MYDTILELDITTKKVLDCEPKVMILLFFLMFMQLI